MYQNSLIWRFFPKNSKYGQHRHTPFMQILEATVNQTSLGLFRTLPLAHPNLHILGKRLRFPELDFAENYV